MKAFRTFYRTTAIVLLNTIVLLFAFEAMLRFVLNDDKTGETNAPGIASDRRIAAEVYEAVDWAAGYWQEFKQSDRTRWEPYVYWRRPAFTGDHININSAGIRRTWNQAGADAGALTVLVFGGSTVWGTGTPDDHTIPSFISKQLADRGVKANVINLGESGYVSTQGAILLLRMLQRGDRPDVVVFYDGVNDTYSAYQQNTPGIPLNEFNRRKEFNLLKQIEMITPTIVARKLDRLSTMKLVNVVRRKFGREAYAPREFDPGHKIQSPRGEPENAARAADTYLANISAIRALGETFGFETLFYLQPTLYTKHEKSKHEAREYRMAAKAEHFFGTAYAAIRARLEDHEDARDISGIFDDKPAPVFIDWCHIGSEGNRIVGETITADILALSRVATSETAVD